MFHCDPLISHLCCESTQFFFSDFKGGLKAIGNPRVNGIDLTMKHLGLKVVFLAQTHRFRA